MSNLGKFSPLHPRFVILFHKTLNDAYITSTSISLQFNRDAKSSIMQKIKSGLICYRDPDEKLIQN